MDQVMNTPSAQPVESSSPKVVQPKQVPTQTKAPAPIPMALPESWH